MYQFVTIIMILIFILSWINYLILLLVFIVLSKYRSYMIDVLIYILLLWWKWILVMRPVLPILFYGNLMVVIVDARVRVISWIIHWLFRWCWRYWSTAYRLFYLFIYIYIYICNGYKLIIPKHIYNPLKKKQQIQKYYNLFLNT
jgi:hypothetical protein